MSGVKQLVGFVNEESYLAKDGVGVLKGLEGAEQAAEKMLGKTNAGAAIEVKKLLDEARSDQRQIIHNEMADMKSTNGLIKSEKKASLAQQKSTVSAGSQASSSATRLAKVAARERKLANMGQHVLGEMQHTEHVVESTLGKQNAQVASEVEGLLNQAIGYSKQAAHAETEEAARSRRMASEAMARVHSSEKAHVHHTVAETEGAATAAARFEHAEGQLAKEGRKIVGEMKHTESAVTAALGHSQMADEVEGLLRKAQHYQTKVDIMEDKMSKSALPAAKHRGALAQEHATVLSSSKVRQEMHAKSRLMANRKLFKEEQHVDGEVMSARYAVAETLGGTEVGAEVAKLLGGAEKAVREVTLNTIKDTARVEKIAK
eukprot:gnl/TRDRNA2_/TRDRNA2_130542_c0_seq1.p1 gnl/TRDRNA2_/TRDRNA2_130542_c0~~gnl/TRDRNA2_/TRDRNA2_130542_c0_seq1.p1  ORF type:complete len:388 (+),score=128.08 gnl/TRDRNA2_/TRDRNA2_130542_c0_seq1:41-1165(+)